MSVNWGGLLLLLLGEGKGEGVMGTTDVSGALPPELEPEPDPETIEAIVLVIVLPAPPLALGDIVDVTNL